MARNVQGNVSPRLEHKKSGRADSPPTRVFAKLLSGYRIKTAVDDTASVGARERMVDQVRDYLVAERYARDDMNMLLTADGAAWEIHDGLALMREIAAQASHCSLWAMERVALNAEFQAVLDEIDHVANASEVDGTKVLAGPVRWVVLRGSLGGHAGDGLCVRFGGASATALAVRSLDVLTEESARRAVAAIEAADRFLGVLREGFVLAIQRMRECVSNLQSIRSNTSASLSSIRDVDIAEEYAIKARELAMRGASRAAFVCAGDAAEKLRGPLHNN